MKQLDYCDVICPKCCTWTVVMINLQRSPSLCALPVWTTLCFVSSSVTLTQWLLQSWEILCKELIYRLLFVFSCNSETLYLIKGHQTNLCLSRHNCREWSYCITDSRASEFFRFLKKQPSSIFFFFQIMSDPRVRIEQSLWKAGLYHSQYAKNVLSTIQPPKPPRKDTKSTLKFWIGACLGSCVFLFSFFLFCLGSTSLFPMSLLISSPCSGLLLVLWLLIVVDTGNKSDVIFGLLLQTHCKFRV